KKLAFSSTCIALLTVALLSPPSASAASDCVFLNQLLTGGMSMTLQNDCFTDLMIEIPNNWTLDGGGHTITARDPVGGHFLGDVIRNVQGATLAYVTNVKITAMNLMDFCDPASPTDTRLRGILFDGAGGVISHNEIINLRQGTGAQPSGCQEGNAIEVRNGDGSGPKVQVTISDNTVRQYQKTGIVTLGSVDASIHRNVVQGFGPI